MIRLILLLITLLATANLAANEQNLFEFMQEYLDFAPYADGTISSEQLNSVGVENFVFIDTRNAGQFAKGHIPGAMNIDWREILKRKNEVPKDKPVIMYCETGLLSSKAHYMLQLAGYENVKVLWGGYLVWSARQSFDEAAKFSTPE
ncbi:MAG: rhodanese-like domain-containing protein [Gammaproteobacteria bacterium]|nr:rhodanese-like domain-containing protein [Gammaproteobacteria bacterium]